MPADPPALAQRKSDLRKTAGEARKAAAAVRTDAGAALAAVFAQNLQLPEGAVVSGYWPMGSEIDVRPLMHRLADAGHALCLPVVAARGAPLAFRRWRPGDALVGAGFGTSEPEPSADEVEPDVFLVPLLAFDRQGRRLGYGGGFYDRTLSAARRARHVIAAGVAYAAQEVALVPAGPADELLDVVVTETGLIRI